MGIQLQAIDLSQFEAVFLDLDGTIYHEDHPLPGSSSFVAALSSTKVPFACMTNSASSPQRVVVRLKSMGIEIDASHVYTAAAATADYILQRFQPVAEIPLRRERSGLPHVFNLASNGIDEMLGGKVHWVQSSAEKCDVVAIAAPSGPFATQDRQRIALELLRGGAVAVALCGDRVYPSPRGIEFGAGAQAAMLAFAANVQPVYCGKPQPLFFQELCRRLRVESNRCLLIGDNLESDIAGAKAVGMKTILTLTGVARRQDLDGLSISYRPDWIVDDLTDLQLPVVR